MTMKSRFCPSPTGYIHLGNARTALFNALLAKSMNGSFLLRIEDTDKARSSSEYCAQLLADMKWLFLDWQEGPEVGGPHEPYWQSQRQPIYDNYYQQLEQQNLAYPCFCTEQQLAINRKAQQTAGQPPRYPGTCRNLSANEIQLKLDAGLKPTLRFKMPNNQQIIFDDLVRSKQTFKSNDIGDFIIRRADGTASFMYCNAIDDALMEVTHAMRGEDHLTNSPRQISILKSLKLPIPNYVHISLILGMDGAPLSKRNGSQSVKNLRERGYFAIAIVNHLARLGHFYSHDELLSFDELAKQFSIKHLSRSPAKFDIEQLNRWQKVAVLKATLDQLTAWLPAETLQRVSKEKRNAFLEVIQANICFPEDATLWANAIFSEQLNLSEEYREILRQTGKPFFDTAIDALDKAKTDFKLLCNLVKDQTGNQGKQLFMPLRIALTGQAHGPEMARILPLMGQSLATQRFAAVLNLIT